MPLILMVDGEPSIRRLYSLILSSLGVETLQIHEFSKALSYLDSRPPPPVLGAVFINLPVWPRPALEFMFGVNRLVPPIPIVVIAMIESHHSVITRLIEESAVAYLFSPTKGDHFKPVLTALGLYSAKASTIL